MSELPLGWADVPLGSLLNFKYGKALPDKERSGKGFPVYGSNGVVGWHSHALTTGTTIVIGRKGSVGALQFSNTPCSPIDTTYYIDEAPGHQFRFWFYRLKSLGLASLNKSTAIPGLSRGDAYQIVVALPPLAEQKRIADKLDTVLTRVDAVNTRLARVAPLLKRFRQSVLAAATSGRLTEDWRNAQKAADWMPRTVGSLCLQISDGPFGSNLKSDDYTEEGARVVRLENIGHLSFDNTKKTFVAFDKYETLKKHTLNAGDLLFSSFVDEEVRVCEFPAGVVEPTINKADCFCVRVDETKVSRHFLMFRLACKSTYQELKELVHGATRPRINLGQLRRFELMLPSPAEQTEIVRRVETLFAFADRLEARLAQAQTAATRLTPALLAKAFRGELVPQDPNDEPAAELLRRLQAERASAPKASAGRGRKAVVQV